MKLWEVKTNRHPNCDGTAWGWIQGPGPSRTWSNATAFNRDAAEQWAREQNELLRVGGDQ